MPSSTLLSTHQGCLQTHFKLAASRRLLGHAYVLFNQDSAVASAPAAAPVASASAGARESTAFSSINANVVMILAVLLCALICALVVNAVVRCFCGVASRAWFKSEGDSAGGGSVRPCASERQASARVRRKRAVRSLPCFAYATGGVGVIVGCGTECAICISEFAPGERVRVLPKCGHGFHVRCIDRWLAKQSSCPTCRQCLFGHDEEAGRPAAVTGDYREEDQ